MYIYLFIFYFHCYIRSSIYSTFVSISLLNFMYFMNIGLFIFDYSIYFFFILIICELIIFFYHFILYITYF